MTSSEQNFWRVDKLHKSAALFNVQHNMHPTETSRQASKIYIIVATLLSLRIPEIIHEAKLQFTTCSELDRSDRHAVPIVIPLLLISVPV